MILDALLDELAAAPSLPGARCVGRHDLFDRTIEAQRNGPAGARDVAEARAAALRVCQRCPQLERCGAWLDSLPPKHRPLGVVAGRVITSRNRSARPDTTPEGRTA